MVAGRVAGRFPELVDRLVLFAPFARRDSTGLPDAAALGGWFPLTVAEQHSRFVSDVPDGHPPVLTPQFDQWASEWLATDPVSGGGGTPSVRTPSGPRADMLAAWSGDLPYEPGLIEAPACIVRGEWDSMCTDEDARGLCSARDRMWRGVLTATVTGEGPSGRRTIRSGRALSLDRNQPKTRGSADACTSRSSSTGTSRTPSTVSAEPPVRPSPEQGTS